VTGCLERGLLVNCTAERVLRFLPPLIVGREELDEGLAILDEVLAA
jgi:4-aminobutyrate aminotransferase-like enzyme